MHLLQKTKNKKHQDDNKIDVTHKNIVLKNLANKIASTESIDYDSDSSTLSDGVLNKSRKMSPKFVSEPNLSLLSNEETPKNTKKRLFRSKLNQNTGKKYQKRAIRTTPTCVSCIDQDSEDSYNNFNTPKKNEPTDNEIEFKLHYLTSTPGISDFEEFDNCETPYIVNFRRASMSPITKSTQKLSKAMQVCCAWLFMYAYASIFFMCLILMLNFINISYLFFMCS